MKRIVTVKLKKQNKKHLAVIPDDLQLENEKLYILDTGNGLEICEIGDVEKTVENETIADNSMKLVRAMTEEDYKQEQENAAKEKEAYQICLDKIKEKQMSMKMDKADYNFDRSKITFYFTSDTRIDFRDLVKDLAFALRTKIEMKQIGAREKATMIGGCGPCGRLLCCSLFLKDYPAVSMRLAKDQNVASNPAKISGMCGRLFCCLAYEHDDLKKKKHNLPPKSQEEAG